MTGIDRNGLSGLAFRIAVIALAAFMFGCSPKASSTAQAVPPANSWIG